MLKLLVFDWDGTLADSVSKIIECKRFLAKKYQLPLPADEVVKSVLGMKFEDALAKCFPEADKKTLDILGKEFHELMQQDKYQASLFPETKEMLETLKKHGFKLAIATSKFRKELDNAIIYNQLSHVFDVTCCGDEHPGKPNPAMLYHAMKKCVAHPEGTLMIGDTIFDILLAANAGVKAVGVAFGAHSITKLRSANPIAVINDWNQLLTIIDEPSCYLNQIYCRL